jgi:hypothetical protein
METSHEASLSLTIHSSTENDESTRMSTNLLQNINSTGTIRATNAHVQEEHVDDQESKSDGVLLGTLIVTFVKAGSATALINALVALFKSSRDKELKATIKANGKTLEVSAHDLNGSDFQALVKGLEQEIRHG